MPSLPTAIVSLLSPFASLFDARTWRKAQRLLIGAVMAAGLSDTPAPTFTDALALVRATLWTGAPLFTVPAAP